MSLRHAVEGWLAAGRAAHWSRRTLGDHQQNLDRFAWWLLNEAEVPADLNALTAFNVRRFLGYLQEPHPTGRFGCTKNAGARREARPSTVAAYHRDLKAFVAFLIAEDVLATDPLKNLKPPKIPTDQVQPFTGDQVQALLEAARTGRNPERDTALVLLLVDSGLRASELCALKCRDVDRMTGKVTVAAGKGGKARHTYLGARSRRAVWRYVEKLRPEADAQDPLFVSTGGHTPGAAFTRSGLGILIADMGRRAGITGVRCSPHTCRHFFAVEFLRAGGNVLELQRLLGHECLEMTRRYVALAQVDLEDACRRASPADRIKLR